MTPSWFGASVRGRVHGSRGVANQDRWRAWRVGAGWLLAVADGMGSRKGARESATAACLAVRDAVSAHSAGPFQRDQFLRCAESSWRLRLSHESEADLGTTCLFAWLREGSELVLGQNGDGAVIWAPNGESRRLVAESSSWLNEVRCLGSDGHWETAVLRLDGPITVALATDGVADDLEPANDTELLSLLKGLWAMPKDAARSELRRTLVNWPNPNSGDDLTLVVGAT